MDKTGEKEAEQAAEEIQHPLCTCSLPPVELRKKTTKQQKTKETHQVGKITVTLYSILYSHLLVALTRTSSLNTSARGSETNCVVCT